MRESWKTLRAVIPDRACATVARKLRLNPDYVVRWLREPLSDEAPLANGQRSILDRMDDLLEAIFLVNPQGPAFVIEHLKANYEELLGASLDPTYWDRREHAAKTLREVVEAVNCLNLHSPGDETLRELIEARSAIDEAIKRVRRESSMGGGSPERDEGRGLGGNRAPRGEETT